MSEGYWPNETGELKKMAKFKVNLNDYCGYLFDSFSGMATGMGSYFSNPETVGKLSLGNILRDEEFEYGTLAQSHYGVTHSQLRKTFKYAFPALDVDWFIATALVDEGKDTTKITKYYPEVLGKAITSEVPSWFGDTLHIAEEVVTGKIFKNQLGDKYPNLSDDMQIACKVVWLRDHPDPNTGIFYKSILRVDPKVKDKLFESYPEGFMILDFDLGLWRLYAKLTKIGEEINGAK